MIFLERILSKLNGNSAIEYTDVIDGSLIAQSVFTTGYLISSFVVSSNAYAGFLAVFTGLVYLASIIATYYGIRKNINATTYGAVIGSLSILVFLSLQTSIFWGQYSNCETSWATQWRVLNVTYYETLVSKKGSYGDECYNQPAMRSVCTFSVFMFLSYVILLAALLFFKEQILGQEPVNVGYSPVPNSNPLPPAPGYSPAPPNEFTVTLFIYLIIIRINDFSNFR